VCHGNSEGEVLFCEKLNMACGNPRNPVPRALSNSDDKPSPTVLSKAKSPGPDLLNGIDYFATPNGGQFDPTLFGEYRDTTNAIVGDGDFTGGFFNDAFLNTGYGSPFHFGDTPAVQRPNPLEEIERIQDGEDEVVPGEDVNSMLNCHKIWSVYPSIIIVLTYLLCPGTSSRVATTSKMAASTLTTCAQNSVPRRAVPRAVLSSTIRMLKRRLSACPKSSGHRGRSKLREDASQICVRV
jgi:AP-1-like factor